MKTGKPQDETMLPQQESDAFFREIQTLWDEQDSSIERLLAEHSDEGPRSLDMRHRATGRSILMAWSLVLLVLNVAVGIYAIVSLFNSPIVRLQVAGCVLAATGIGLAIQSLYMLHTLRRRGPHSSLCGVKAAPLRRPFSAIRQIAAVSVTVLVVLIGVSNATIGDGYAMTGYKAASRAATVVTVDQMLAKI